MRRRASVIMRCRWSPGEGGTQAVARLRPNRCRRRTGGGAEGLLHFADTLGFREVFLRDRHRRQKDERLRLDAVAQELDERLHCPAALAARELLDGRGQRTITNGGQRFWKRVEAQRDN